MQTLTEGYWENLQKAVAATGDDAPKKTTPGIQTIKR